MNCDERERAREDRKKNACFFKFIFFAPIFIFSDDDDDDTYKEEHIYFE